MMRFFMWSSAKLSRAVITVSQCSKRDLMNIYGLPESKISVIYSGYDEVFFNDVLPDPLSRKNLLARLGIERPYILHHGVIQPRKNLKRLIEAYRLMIHRNPNLDIDLVLAGTVGWQAQDVLEAANSTGRNNGQVILPGALSDAELSLLLKTASLVVMPSLYEGFCLPMVEAMACGTPTIAANTSCLPEVSGGVLKYFDPLSVDDMSACIEQVLDDSSAALALRIKGKERAKHFSWRRCAEETLAVLKAVN
jgi:glycosyltransferase involved in cell wall biosynthesis